MTKKELQKTIKRIEEANQNGMKCEYHCGDIIQDILETLKLEYNLEEDRMQKTRTELKQNPKLKPIVEEIDKCCKIEEKIKDNALLIIWIGILIFVTVSIVLLVRVLITQYRILDILNNICESLKLLEAMK